MRRIRFTGTARLLFTLVGIAAFATVLVVGVRERKLSADLESLASQRLARLARAAELLVASKLETLSDRWHAISGTPQFRANLEVEDAPTLTFYAQQLAEKVRVGAGDATLLENARGADGARLVAQDGRAFAATSVPLLTNDKLPGHLVAVEPIGSEQMPRPRRRCPPRASRSQSAVTSTWTAPRRPRPPNTRRHHRPQATRSGVDEYPGGSAGTRSPAPGQPEPHAPAEAPHPCRAAARHRVCAPVVRSQHRPLDRTFLLGSAPDISKWRRHSLLLPLMLSHALFVVLLVAD